MDREWVSADGTVILFRGDCIEVMRTMPEASVDAIVTDPPYALTGKSRGGSPRTNDPKTPFGRHQLQSKASGGFMGLKWDSELPPVEMWQEALRVAKPGAHLLAFGGTRTYHRLVCAIEDAGWEIRDALCWLYGSGMPKSLDVSKAIDKAAGVKRDDKFEGAITVGRAGPTGNKRCEKCGKWLVSGSPCQCPRPQDAAVTPEAARWSGWGTALKPSVEFIVLARKPLVGTVARNVQQYGTGALNIDACRIGDGVGGWGGMGRYNADRATWNDATSGLKDGAARPTVGRWPGNVLLSHHPDCKPVGTKRVPTSNGYVDAAQGTEETVEVWECVSECPVRMLDEQSGSGGSGSGKVKVSAGTKHSGTWSDGATGMHAAGRTNVGVRDFGDSGGASRFFYTAKPSRSERDDGLEVEDEFPVTDGQKWNPGGIAARRAAAGQGRMRNSHATVKPLALMEYLIKLVTPPGGVVLDPFLGSGTTAVACARLGVRCVGIDLEPQYAQIAVARVRRAREKAGTLAPTEAKAGQQVGLFAVQESGDGSGSESRDADAAGAVDRSGAGPGAGG
jgi:site-specific DNA-methyltransferase (adenine-specific)